MFDLSSINPFREDGKYTIDNLIKIANTDKTAEQANLYGIILYTIRDTYIAEAIHNEIKWRTLDIITGPHWTLFAAKARYLHQTSATRKRETEVGKYAEIMQLCNIESEDQLPALVVFAKGEDGYVYRRVLALESKESQDQAFNVLKEHVEVITDALKKMSTENLRLSGQAFHTAGYALDGQSDWKRIKLAFKFLPFSNILTKVLLPS